MSQGSENATVLVVDDEEEVADVYALRLRNDYDTRVAYGGEDALETIDIDVDIVLLDRRMPDISGDDVLAEIREKGYDCRVIMLTAVDPGLDIVEMPFDDYLCKPVEKDDLVAAINQQLQVQRYGDQLSEYYEVSSKLALLESELPPQEREQSEELDRLTERAEELQEELDDVLDEFETLDDAFRSIGRQPG
ncbi:response regulator transcription factor [Halovenus halobia]|uniref:response regulator transcription factor n=1 Tax=Halovenus halobia TaxID=3396622 RepID=UPI003F556576